MKNVKKAKKGFTLIEMIVVVAIIAVLAGIGIPQITKQIANSKKKADIANAKTIAAMLQQKIGEGDSTLITSSFTEVTTSYVDEVPKVKYNSSWSFVYKYDGGNDLQVGVKESNSSNIHVLYPEVLKNDTVYGK